ncbi:MAG TPA: DUF5362 family protein [Chitinophagales bacterium]|nr:DUF5362 family protein [Chitinophagales bacterium]
MEAEILDTPMADGKLEVDVTNAAYLSETARWAKFLAILGFVMCGIIILVGLFASSLFTKYSTLTGSSFQMAGMGIMLTVIYVLLGVIYFFPCYYLFNFAQKMKLALRMRDQVTLSESFRNIKSCFKFMGILMIIVLAFYAIAIVFGSLAALFM